MTVLANNVGRFARECPDIVLDIISDESRGDLVAMGISLRHSGHFLVTQAGEA